MQRHLARRIGRVVAAGVIAAVAFSGCGGDDDADVGTPAVTAPADDPDGGDGGYGGYGGSGDDADPDEPGDGASGAALIVISGFDFSGPASVAVGTTVEVRNDDSAPHTWTSVDGVFDSGRLGNGDSFTFTFDEAGEYPFFCEIHPSMTGSITVTN